MLGYLEGEREEQHDGVEGLVGCQAEPGHHRQPYSHQVQIVRNTCAQTKKRGSSEIKFAVKYRPMYTNICTLYTTKIVLDFITNEDSVFLVQ